MKIITKKHFVFSVRMMKVILFPSVGLTGNMNELHIITKTCHEIKRFMFYIVLFLGCIPADEMKFVLSQICSDKVT